MALSCERSAGEPLRMSRFGQYLRDRGALTGAQFEEVCRSQVVFGGRIGSSLVELGYLGLEELAGHLSDYYRVPQPPEAWLVSPDPRALKLIPSWVIRRYHVLPLRLEAESIHVAMLDPKDRHQLDLLGDMARRPVRPYVLPEVSLLHWLEVHCGIDPHPRYKNLAARAGTSDAESSDLHSHFAPLAKGEELSNEIVFTTPPSGLAPLRRDRPQSPTAPIDEHLLEEIVLVDEVSKADVAASFAVPSGPGEIAALEAQLQAAGDRDRVIDLGLRLASAFAPGVALFLVRKGMVVGHRAVTHGVAARLDTILLPVQIPSLFTQPAVTNQSFRGHPPHDGMDGRILDAIGRSDAHEVLIQPVAIQGRVVNLLYADNGPDALADTLVAALGALAATMAAAYERLILEAKRAG